MTLSGISHSGCWAGLVILAGGLLLIILWPIYITAHGPTSFDQNMSVLGRSTLFWGSLLGSLPNIFLAVGMVGLGTILIGSAGTLARVGYALALLGLLIPAGVDLYTRSLGPPWFLPVTGTGLALLALTNWRNRSIGKMAVNLLIALGLLQVSAFAWAFLPQELADSIGGYRIFGVMAHFLVGIGWIFLGVYFLVSRAEGARDARDQPADETQFR